MANMHTVSIKLNGKTVGVAVEPRDPATYTGVVAGVLAAAIVAAAGPARRAARTDPLDAIRAE